LYRAEAAAGTELGKVVGPLLDSGQLVPDDITIRMIRDKILEASDGFVLDGFPRTLPQAEALDQLLDELGRPLSIILLLENDDEVSRERLARRSEIEGRADDTPERITRRLADYHEKTQPVVDHYLATGNLVKVHAERPIEAVWSEVSDALEHLRARA
jgi:adenylate kinase